MSKKFNYINGDHVGPYDIIFKQQVTEKYNDRLTQGLFICPFCGTEFIMPITWVKTGKIKSCGCLHHDGTNNINFIDITGQRYGNLVAKKYIITEKKWLCKCDCGNDYLARRDWLVSGRVISCGCNQHKINDISGRKFGKLTAVYPTDKRTSNRHVIWHCVCDCGNELDVSRDKLIQGITKSCGCLISYGEEIIAKILTQLHITYHRQQMFDDCINPKTGARLRFDFYLTEYNCCIEYDGKQHYEYTNQDWNTEEHYLQTTQNDIIKNNYCLQKRINLIRIPYTELHKINTEYILSLLI